MRYCPFLPNTYGFERCDHFCMAYYEVNNPGSTIAEPHCKRLDGSAVLQETIVAAVNRVLAAKELDKEAIPYE